MAKVIKVTKPLKYRYSDGKRKQVFHALVLNASAKTRIKIFDAEKHPLFKKNKTIEISNYYKKEGYLQVVKHSICEIKEEELVIPKKMHKDAVKRTRIEDIWEMPEKSYVDGTFTVKEVKSQRHAPFFLHKFKPVHLASLLLYFIFSRTKLGPIEL